MPKCYKCNAPIIFAPIIDNWSHTIAGRPLPINVDPDTATGTLSLFKWPVTFRNLPPADGSVPILVARRQGGEALAWLRRQPGVALYRVHFDTCTGR